MALSSKKKKCTTGLACGGTCIAQGKTCKGALGTVSAGLAGWLKNAFSKLKGVLTGKKPQPAAKPAAAPTTTKAEPESDTAKPWLKFDDAPTKAQLEKRIAEYDNESSEEAVSRVGGPPPTVEQAAALRRYTNGDDEQYRYMNGMLRGDYDPGDTREIYEQEIATTRAALNSLPPFQGTVYRGTTLSQAELERYQPGQMVEEKAFMSTSQTSSVTGDFSLNLTGGTAVEYTIASRTGRDIARLSELPEEREVLFQPGTRFNVLSRETRPNGVVRIYMEEA